MKDKELSKESVSVVTNNTVWLCEEEGDHEDPVKVSCSNMEEFPAKDEALDDDNIWNLYSSPALCHTCNSQVGVKLIQSHDNYPSIFRSELPEGEDNNQPAETGIKYYQPSDFVSNFVADKVMILMIR